MRLNHRNVSNSGHRLCSKPITLLTMTIIYEIIPSRKPYRYLSTKSKRIEFSHSLTCACNKCNNAFGRLSFYAFITAISSARCCCSFGGCNKDASDTVGSLYLYVSAHRSWLLWHANIKQDQRATNWDHHAKQLNVEKDDEHGRGAIDDGTINQRVAIIEDGQTDEAGRGGVGNPVADSLQHWVELVACDWNQRARMMLGQVFFVRVVVVESL